MGSVPVFWQNCLDVEDYASDLAEFPVPNHVKEPASDLAESPVPVILQNCLSVEKYAVPVIW